MVICRILSVFDALFLIILRIYWESLPFDLFIGAVNAAIDFYYSTQNAFLLWQCGTIFLLIQLAFWFLLKRVTNRIFTQNSDKNEHKCAAPYGMDALINLVDFCCAKYWPKTKKKSNFFRTNFVEWTFSKI